MRVAIIPNGAISSAVGEIEVICGTIVASRVVEFRRTVFALFAEPQEIAIAITAVDNISTNELGMS